MGWCRCMQNQLTSFIFHHYFYNITFSSLCTIENNIKIKTWTVYTQPPQRRLLMPEKHKTFLGVTFFVNSAKEAKVRLKCMAWTGGEEGKQWTITCPYSTWDEGDRSLRSGSASSQNREYVWETDAPSPDPPHGWHFLQSRMCESMRKKEKKPELQTR